MSDKNVNKGAKAERRRRRVRAKVYGTAERPRLSVCKSLNNVSVQIIDDDSRATLVGLSSSSKLMKESLAGSKENKTAVAKIVGKKVAEMAKEKGIVSVVFDRNRYLYHGRIKAVADGAREGGLKF